MADAHPHTPGLVGPVNQVTRHAQTHGVLPQRVIRPRGHDPGQGIAHGGVFPAHGLGYGPLRVGRLLDNAGLSLGGFPALPAYAHRVGDNLGGLSRRRFGKIEQAHGGEVQHQPLACAGREHEFGGQYHRGAFPRQPGIDTRVGGHYLLVAQVIAPGYISKRILRPGRGHLNFTDHIGPLRGQRKAVAGGGGRRGLGELAGIKQGATGQQAYSEQEHK